MFGQGGCCKICEGVTHLAKDCPQKNSGKFAGNARVKLKICKSFFSFNFQSSMHYQIIDPHFS